MRFRPRQGEVEIVQFAFAETGMKCIAIGFSGLFKTMMVDY